MRILVISSRYPPFHFGGYEIRIKNIIDELFHRGHTIKILSSVKETLPTVNDKSCGYCIQRRLHVQSPTRSWIDQLTRKRKMHGIGMLLTFIRGVLLDLYELAYIERKIRQFQPEVIYLGHISPLSRSILLYLAELQIPVVYDEGGSGLIDAWEEKGIWYKFVEEFQSQYQILRGIKSLLLKIIPKISSNRLKARWDWPCNMQIFFNSKINYNNAIARGVPTDDARIIHSGIDTRKFYFRPRDRIREPLTILIPGRMEPRKGQKDSLQVLKELGDQGVNGRCIFAGERWSKAYSQEFDQQVSDLQLEGKVTMLSMQTQERLIELYHQADICFFPSKYRTGFSRIPLEAMACGCVVISYGNEGSDEVIEDRHSGFLVTNEDFHGTVQVIFELVRNSDLIKVITTSARKEIEEFYSLTSYIDKIEEVVREATAV